jgi:hypothetical protein
MFVAKILNILDIPLLKTTLLLLVICKYKPEIFLLTANENYSKTGVTDTVPPFPRIILQKAYFSMDKPLYSLQF